MSHYYKMSHAMMLDEPVGYAFSGPPMQKKVIAQSLEKSKGIGIVIGVIAGVVTMGVGFAAMAAAGGIAAGMTLGTISAGAMIAGGAMTAVGAITGNAKLSKIGGILSLAGGVGGMVNNLATGGSSLLDASKASTINSAGERVATEATTQNFTNGLGKMADSFGSSFDKALGSTAATGAESATGAAAPSTAPPTIDVNAGAAAPVGDGATITLGDSGKGILESSMGASDADVINNAMATAQSATAPAPSTAPAQAAPAQAAPSNSGSMMSNVNDAAKLLAGQQKPKEDQGLLSSVMNMSTGAGTLASGAVKAIGDGASGSAAEDAAKKQYELTMKKYDADQLAAQQQYDLYKQKYSDEQAALEMKKKNMNAKFEYIDPNDPQAEQKKAAARAAGAIPIMLGVNANAGPVTANGTSMVANTVTPAPQVQRPITTVAANGVPIDDKNKPLVRA